MNNGQPTRRMIKAGAILAISASTILGSNAITAKPAQADWNDAVRYLEDNWGAVVSNVWSPWNIQVYMTSLSPSETRAVQNQYRSRANGVLFDRCVNKVADTYWKGWWRTALKSTHRWVIDMRVENGQANCYERMPNGQAREFIRRRGW